MIYFRDENLLRIHVGENEKKTLGDWRGRGRQEEIRNWIR
jgi:hypothetical protein